MMLLPDVMGYRYLAYQGGYVKGAGEAPFRPISPSRWNDAMPVKLLFAAVIASSSKVDMALKSTLKELAGS